MAEAKFKELGSFARKVDAFQIPIKVTINIFLSSEEGGLLREAKIKEFRVNFVDDAIAEIRNYLLDRIQELNSITCYN